VIKVFASCHQSIYKTYQEFGAVTFQFERNFTPAVLLSTLVSVFLIGTETPAFAQKYTPDHPAVQEMVNRGMNFLANEPTAVDEGETILVGYCAYKVNGDPNDKLVKAGVAAALKLSQSLSSSTNRGGEQSMYVIALAAMILPSVDVDAYGGPTKQIRDFMLSVQKQNGGFGYLTGSNAVFGDISQTQYVMLSFWTMNQLGIEVPPDAVAATVNFLLASQENTGGWPYQYKSPGVTQMPPSNSLTAAGLSALLIGGDLLGLYRSKQQENQEEEGIIPLAFRRVLSEAQRPKLNFEKSRVDASSKRSEAWFAANPYTRDANFHYYYVYSRERYESFLEITKGKQSKSPDWYNDGVRMLMDAQDDKGAWGAKGEVSTFLRPPVATSFAILFLIRSTQKAIGDLSEALNKGIGELPDDVTSIATSGGKIVNKNSATSIDEALKMLEDDSKADGEDALAPEKMLLATDPKQRQEQINRFVRLLNAKDYKARQVAAKMLGRGDSLDVVPSLIYALTDPDPRVPFYAEQSLRLISRQLDTYHLPKKEKISDQDKNRAATQWKKWFLGLRPDYVFVD